ncbi:MAG: hypothetical protein V1777_02710 [Candidatus Micrarchaeota archaeon]
MKAVFGLVLVLILLTAGCVQSGGFSGNYREFKAALERNGTNETVLLPPTLEQLRGLQIELFGLQSAVEQQASGQDKEASLALLDLEGDLVNMQENYFLGTEQTQFVNYAFLSCDSKSNIKRATAFFDKAGQRADLAAKKSGAFAINYKNFADQTPIDFSNLSALVNRSKALFSNLKGQAQKFCQ